MFKNNTIKGIVMSLTFFAFFACDGKPDSKYGILPGNLETSLTGATAVSVNSYVVMTSDPADTGCSITVTTDTAPTTPGSVNPGQAVTFEMEGADILHIENSGFIAGLSNSVGDLPATHSIIAPDVTTRYVLSVFTVDGVRTRHNNCEVTLNVVPKTGGTAPAPSCEIEVDRPVIAYGEPITLSWTSVDAVQAEISPTNAVGVIPVGQVATGSWSYKSYYGDHYSMKVWNEDGVSAQCAVSINQISNTPATTQDGAYVGAVYHKSIQVRGTLIATDLENDQLTFSVQTPPAKGVVTIHNPATGEFSYKANPGQSGLDSFTFVAHDGTVNSNVSTIQLNIHKPGAVRISAGYVHSCVVQDTGKVKCWGKGENGELGNGLSENQSQPVEVSGINNAVQVSSGAYFACAVLDAGKVNCWGKGDEGQLGNGVIAASNVPVEVSGLTNVVQVASGYQHSCALLGDSTVSCWGNGDNGQMGDGTEVSQLTPVPVAGVAGAVQVISGRWHSCALLDDGTISCWGYGGFGQLGQGSWSIRFSLPTPVINIDNAIQIASSGTHTCAVLSNGKVNCWGDGADGELGNNETNPRFRNQNAPVEVVDISNAVEVSAGASHTCALLDDASLRCWGAGFNGALGFGLGGLDAYAVLSPVQVLNINNAVQISAGGFHTCSLQSDDGVKCWGEGNNGTLGNGDVENQLSPVGVLNLP